MDLVQLQGMENFDVLVVVIIFLLSHERHPDLRPPMVMKKRLVTPAPRPDGVSGKAGVHRERGFPLSRE